MKATLKVRLMPNKEQEKKFIEFANAARFVYNYSLGLKVSEYTTNGISLSLADLLREVRFLFIK